MYYLLIRHQVADFAKWKLAYDAHRPIQQQAGLTEAHLLHTVDKPNEVTILFAAEDLDKAKAFASSPDLLVVMQQAGVLGQPELYFLTT